MTIRDMSPAVLTAFTLLALGSALAAAGPQISKGRDQAKAKQPSQDSPCQNVPGHPLDLILARPSATRSR